MNAKEFFKLIKAMRKAQKDYFRYRSNISLEESKKLERKVDEEIRRADNAVNERMNPRLDFSKGGEL